MPYVYLATLIQNLLDAELLTDRSSLPPDARQAQQARVSDTRRCVEQYIAALPHESPNRQLADCVRTYFAALDAYDTGNRSDHLGEDRARALCGAEDDLQDVLYQFVRPKLSRAQGLDRRRILVAIRDEPASDQALYAAIHLAEAMPSRLKLVHIIETPSADTCRPRHGDLDDLARMKQASELLNKKQREVPNGIGCETLVRLGDPVQEIVSAARRWGADFIVMGIHRRRYGESANDVDHVAEIIPQASCPVIVVGRPAAQRKPAVVNRIFPRPLAIAK